MQLVKEAPVWWKLYSIHALAASAALSTAVAILSRLPFTNYFWITFLAILGAIAGLLGIWGRLVPQDAADAAKVASLQDVAK